MGSPTAAGRCRYFDPEAMGAAIGEAMASTEALLFGRRTWRVMADAWPGRAGDPFADQMNAIEKYVVSRTLTEADLDWNGTAADRRRRRPRAPSPRSGSGRAATCR